ncbi:MAG: divergent polysaccharide deacetylase family protein [Candidatus Hatepunaea meridiana]|nr:divergent polysaccharide deacetylase family protein [Candidatus Hatepunaea meridiana]
MVKQTKSNRRQTRIYQRFSIIIAIIVILFVCWFYLIRSPEIAEEPSYIDFSAPEYLESDSKCDTIESELRDDNVPSSEHPWVAIIIDDFGPPGTAKVIKGFLKLPFDLTFSIIPGNRKSLSIGKTINDAGGEVIIHLPMEPIELTAMGERDMIMTDIDSTRLKVILDRVTTEFPYAVGMNNHMGSRATSDDRLMNMLAVELKERNLIFIDSRTVPNSRALPAMKSVGVPALGRDVFLDNYRDVENIQRQINALLKVADRRGWAIGIGHANKVNLEALTEAIPIIEASDVKFVTVSALINGVGKKNSEGRRANNE